jgi:SAM-dependent methyltransferase
MKYNVNKINGICRICHSENVKEFLNLDNMPFTDDFVSQNQLGLEFLYPIRIFCCDDCKTVQTQHDVEVSDYYEDYQYSVGASGFASDFMNNIAKNICDTYFPDTSDVKVLEVGSGDGGQLVPFKALGCKVLGFEPSSYLVQVAAEKGIESVQNLFTSESVKELPDEFKNVQVIFLSYTFDHLPDPVGFLKTALQILDNEKGIIVIENHDLQKIFERQEYCLFEHEHSIYLTKSTAISLAKRNDMEVIGFDILPEEMRRANSLVFVITPKNSKWHSRAINEYSLPEYNGLEFYNQQAHKIYKAISNFERYIEGKTAQGITIAGYGAGGRGIMTLSALNNAGKLKYIVDKKPKADGVYTPKFHLPVYSIYHLHEEPVDEVIVFSFGYMSEILTDLKNMGYKENQIHSMLKILKYN